ncbi:uncharacterized protein MELLADRAFT_105234 [Melampsora larici-populina 98AG31]|uniref:F-box domain-containing protein n=1 Tax=Melampsora larici-populina (strain 98AG31 / pathotype 3-4-7) TaxID=747676 RepID=F4RHA4_MELLP|nr:uncharacterized protein MELLADRAFT_105234 [Melampsora larici-populina 98AG31]EGG08287.1 hypothetical protein MELLADRAFT_105234 [Melampsora larici-populina 98AG31]
MSMRSDPLLTRFIDPSNPTNTTKPSSTNPTPTTATTTTTSTTNLCLNLNSNQKINQSLHNPMNNITNYSNPIAFAHHNPSSHLYSVHLSRPLPITFHHPNPLCRSDLHQAWIDALPNELLVEIFKLLPSLDESLDLLSVSLVCRKWRAPAQSVLWKYLRFPNVECVTCFAEASKLRPDLAKLSRRLNFSTDEPEYLACLDADAVFTSMESLTGLERFEVTVPYASGELYDSLCEELSAAPIKEVLLSAEEGIGRRHVQASMRFPQITYLQLVRLGELGDLETLAEEWPSTSNLTELVLVNPDLPGEDLNFLLSYTRPTLKKLSIDFGDSAPDESQLTEEDVSEALIQSGGELEELVIIWPNVTYPFLNQAVSGLGKLRHLTIGGITCDDQMDRNCPASLISMTLHINVGFDPSKYFEKFWDPTFRRSNLSRYFIVTRKEEGLGDGMGWNDMMVGEWKECARKLKLTGIVMTGDFF